MSVTIHSLGIDRLPVEDRVRLAEELWASVEAELEITPLSPALRAELERRVASDDADPDAGSSWDEVKARLLGRK